MAASKRVRFLLTYRKPRVSPGARPQIHWHAVSEWIKRAGSNAEALAFARKILRRAEIRFEGGRCPAVLVALHRFEKDRVAVIDCRRLLDDRVPKKQREGTLDMFIALMKVEARAFALAHGR